MPPVAKVSLIIVAAGHGERLGSDLPKQYREQLARWNQSHQKQPIRTFSDTFELKGPPWLHRQVMRRLYRAEEKFRSAPPAGLYA